MENVVGSNGERAVRLLTPESGVDSEVWLAALIFGAIENRDLCVEFDDSRATKRARALRKGLTNNFLDSKPAILYGSDIDLLRAGLEAEIKREKPESTSMLQDKAYESYQQRSRQLLEAITAGADS